jgi:hypothetical protein
MPAVQRNFNYFSYVSDDGVTYNLRCDQDWGDNAASGLTARGNHPAYGRATRRRHPRYFLYRDPTTFRTFRGPVGTAAAYTAAAIGDTLALAVPGETGTVNYQLVKKIPEAIPSTIVGRQNPDHA